MKVDDELIERLQAHAAQARKKVKDTKAIPGKSDFRRAWVKDGPDDVEAGIEIWKANRRAYEKAREQQAGHRKSLHRLDRLEKEGQTPSGSVGKRHRDLQDALERATAEKDDLGEQLSNVDQQHEEILSVQREQLSSLEKQRDQLRSEATDLLSDLNAAEKDIKQLRVQLEDLQDAAARLGPLLAQAKRHYKMAEGEGA